MHLCFAAMGALSILRPFARTEGGKLMGVAHVVVSILRSMPLRGFFLQLRSHRGFPFNCPRFSFKPLFVCYRGSTIGSGAKKMVLSGINEFLTFTPLLADLKRRKEERPTYTSKCRKLLSHLTAVRKRQLVPRTTERKRMPDRIRLLFLGLVASKFGSLHSKIN